MEMVRHIVATIILCLGLLTVICPTTGIGLTLDDELQDLTENYARFKEGVQKKKMQLEERVRRLEEQLRRKKEIEQDLESQVTRLESKLQQHESRLADLNPRPLTNDSIQFISNSDTQPVGVFHGMPTSCADLRQIGYILDGFYWIMRNATVENVYCNFARDPNSPGFQQWTGYGNVTPSSIYFYVQKTTSFAGQATPISFNIVRTNVGRAMSNGTSGKFTAPHRGTYFFVVNGLAKFPASSSSLRLGLGLRLNNELAGRVEEATDVIVTDKIIPLALQATLNLESGDEVWIEIFLLSPGSIPVQQQQYPFYLLQWLAVEREDFKLIVSSLKSENK